MGAGGGRGWGGHIDLTTFKFSWEIFSKMDFWIKNCYSLANFQDMMVCFFKHIHFDSRKRIYNKNRGYRESWGEDF